MKVKLLSTIIITTLALLLPMQATAYDFMVNGLCYNKNSDNTSVTVTYEIPTANKPHYNNLKGDLIIPESVTYDGTTYSVTAIGTDAFRECRELTSATIPNSITTIGNGAFYFCTGMTSVVIPNSVTVIDMNALRECSSLTSVTIPNSVTTIGGDAFNNCKSITSITIPNSVTSIGAGAFYGCSGLTSMTIPNSVTSIGNLAFYNCTSLEQIYSQIEDPSPSKVTLGAIVFMGVKTETCILYVPTGTKELYQEATQWKDFVNIIELEGSTLITNIAFEKKSTIAEVGLNILLEPIITPNDATNKELVWTSSDETVATVDNFGKVTTLKGGIATITASTTDGSNLSASYDVYVIDRNILIDAIMASGNVVSGNINTETILPFIVRNGIDITSISFTIKLPEHIELVNDINSFLEASVRGENFTFTATQNEDGSITINGTASKPLEIGVGVVLNLKVKSQRQGTYTIPISNMIVTTVDGMIRPLLNSETKLIIQSVFGDINGDGDVDIADVTALFDYIFTIHR